jgi:hypothetical protein
MPRLIGARAAGKVALIALAALALFHVAMLTGLLPSEMVWGGRAAGEPGVMLKLELVGLVVTVLFGLIIAARIGLIRSPVPNKVIVVCTWIVFAYFVLNVLANLASTSTLERAVFTPVSLLVALLTLRAAVERSGTGSGAGHDG